MSLITARKEMRILILGITQATGELIREIDNRPRSGLTVVGVLDDHVPAASDPANHLFLGPLSGLERVIEQRRPHCIVVALSERRGHSPLRVLLDAYVSRGIVVEDAARFAERFTGQVPLEALTPMGIVYSGSFRPSAGYQACAHALSVLVAIVALVVLSPLLALIAAAIKADSPGPVLFRQTRAGARGRPFALLKFRTMKDGGARRSEWEADNRDQVTRVGKWLRAFRLDEMPQFVNIVRGEMNLVGPRPHPVSNLAMFTVVARNLSDMTGVAVGCYPLRLMVRPGLTGWAQVRYRYANNLHEEIEKLRFDLYYVRHMSLWLDLRIMFETVAVMVRGHAVSRPAPAPAAVRRAPARRYAFHPKVTRTT
jgi:lipopolysaccharide/colanic/teichoic acid biosynthesis glycosyltransferase